MLYKLKTNVGNLILHQFFTFKRGWVICCRRRHKKYHTFFLADISKRWISYLDGYFDFKSVNGLVVNKT